MKFMSIKKIKASNYKSFKDLDVTLSDFNVIIGPNSSGKSNFISILQFLRDIINSGIENAISLQGGIEYILNAKAKDSPMEIEVLFNGNISFGFGNRNSRLDITSILYRINIGLSGKPKKLKKYSYKETIEFNLKDNLKVSMSNANGKIKLDDELAKKLGDFTKLILNRDPSDKSILTLMPIIPFFERSNIPQIYDIDPKLSKHSIPLSGMAELEQDGNNIALILKNLAKQDDSMEKLINLIGTCLPFINKIDIESLSDKSIILNVRENFNKNLTLPAAFISDGTIEIITLMDILYFERRNVVAIEEPEKNIHPALLQKLVELMKEASKNKQLIITTHSPEIINYIDIKNIFIIKRDPDGFSVMTKPEEDKALKYFLDEEISISQLLSDGFLN
ncbi:MAG: AAA family ATPase [Ferroplasma sp.]